ncbi:hypothetical protein BX667DRAFT_532507 [Coemansia mojavensis]|nr:hypothetical protein BX667DRAFT_532507 [Coemansia mojavensis]
MSIQDLSSDILYLIVRAAVTSLVTEEFELEPVHIKELLGVSRSWRAVAIPIYCSCITICSIADRKSMYWARKGLSATKAHDLNWQSFARRAVVVVSGHGASAEEMLAELGDCLAFARKHAATLVALSINYIHVRDCTSVFLDEQGCEIVYKQVEVLKLDVLGAYDHAMLQQRASPLGNPFPSLKYLNCGSVYPFANNVLLRCAQFTLSKLVISVDDTVAAWLIPEATSLTSYVRLAAIDAHIFAHASTYDQGKEIHKRVLDAASRIPQLQQMLRLTTI